MNLNQLLTQDRQGVCNRRASQLSRYAANGCQVSARVLVVCSSAGRPSRLSPRSTNGLCIVNAISLEKRRQLCLTDRFDISRQNACANNQDYRCPPAQSQEPPRRDSAGEAGGHHRFKRLGEILARFRHALCGRATPLRREPFRLCAAVPRSNGKAGCRFHRRLVACHRHRTTQRRREPTIDNRNHD